MIEYINTRLNDWARWCVSDGAMIRHALGAKSCWPTMLMSDAESTETVRPQGSLVPLNNMECCDTDKAVCALPSDLRLAVVEFYCRVGTGDSAARRCGVSPRTLFRRIDQAHWHVLGTLNDLVAGATLAPCRTLPEKTACVPWHKTV